MRILSLIKEIIKDYIRDFSEHLAMFIFWILISIVELTGGTWE